jgi:medium-chain acyl-[acyl-carrier-protein] hydrolase
MSNGGRWFKRFRRPQDGATTLLCLHHAGGNAAAFREWPRALPDRIDPVAVQLPGRADRSGELAYTRMDELVTDLARALEPMLDRPIAFFGSSMGARVGWSLAHVLRESGMPMPRALFVTASTAPSLDRQIRGWNGPDEVLLDYIQELGGTPRELLEDAELRADILAVLRADLTVLSTHTYQPEVLLDIPITAFAGAHDVESPPTRMLPWRDQTSGTFSMHTVDSGHFLDAAATALVLKTIGSDLS